MGYLLFQPSDDLIAAAGFGSVAHVPIIFSMDWKYHRVASRYMRQRALGQTIPVEFGGGSIPTKQSLTTFGRWLIDFLAWCDWAKISWKDVTYTEDLVLRYQVSMTTGSWSASKQSLSASTINNRTDEAVNFCAWALRVGLREKPFDVPYEQSYRKSGGLSSRTRMVAVKSRKGKIRAAPVDLSLPTEIQVARWLASVKAKFGIVKMLMCRLATEAGLRRQEVVEWDLSYLGTNADNWQVRDENVILQIQYGTKGEKYADEFASLGATPVSRTVGPARFISVPLDLALDLLEYRNKLRPKLIRMYVNKETDPASKKRREAEARSWNHRLFLAEYDGRPIQGPTLLKAFKINPPFKEWHTHLGRHYYACLYMLRQLRLLWKASSPAGTNPPPDWVLFQGQAALLMLRRQLGHISERSTETYLVWLLHAFTHNDEYVTALEAPVPKSTRQ
jgi:hypothetical protein